MDPITKHILEQEDKGENDIHDTIIKWIIKNPKAKLEQAKSFANELGIKMEELDHHIFMILSDILSKRKKETDIDNN